MSDFLEADKRRLLATLSKFGEVEGDELTFETGQFDRCDPPNPYVETLHVDYCEETMRVTLSGRPDAFEALFWVIASSGQEPWLGGGENE